MRHDRSSLAVALVCVIAAALVPAPSRAQADLADGELGRWLEEAAGELGETLSRHPRFAGETVRLTTTTPGDAEAGSNQLADAVARRLRQRLLEVEGVRLAADGPRRDCEPPRQIGYLVRVEVAGAGRDARVHIAVVDVAEAVWVSGISLEWQGRLSAAQRRALETPVSRGVPGSAASPIPLDDAAAVAAAVKADLSCTLPAELSGGVFVASPEPVALSRVALALQAELMYEPLAAVTADRQQARWLLSFDAGGPGAGAAADVSELNLTLTDTGGGHSQRVASVFVSSAGERVGRAVADAPNGHEARPVSPAADGAPPRPAHDIELLSDLEMRPARPEGICDDRRNRLNSCVEISFELREAAYLFVVSTREHRVSAAPCDAGVERAEPGRRRYRLRVPPGDYAVSGGRSGPDAGFYVMAVRERAQAERLAEVLGSAPGGCGADEQPPAAWLAALAGVMSGRDGPVVWRALHVAHDTGGIVAL